MAIANLIWGLGAVFAGMVADRYGAGRVVVSGVLATMAGMYVMYAAQSGLDLMLSGILLGIGVSGTGITSLVGAVGRAAPPEKRTSAIASLGMAGGIGGFVAFPYTHLLMDVAGWKTSLLLLLVDDQHHAAAGLAAQRQAGAGRRHGRHADPGRRHQGGLSRIRAICCWWPAFSCAASTSPSTACTCPRSWPTRASTPASPSSP